MLKKRLSKLQWASRAITKKYELFRYISYFRYKNWLNSENRFTWNYIIYIIFAMISTISTLTTILLIHFPCPFIISSTIQETPNTIAASLLKLDSWICLHDSPMYGPSWELLSHHWSHVSQNGTLHQCSFYISYKLDLYPNE